MAVRTTPLDSALGLSGLTVMLALFAFWLGTKKPGAIGDFPKSFVGSGIMVFAVLFVAFWIGARNPSIFGALPILGAAAE